MNDTMQNAVNDFLNLDTRRSVCSVAYTGVGATPGFEEINAVWEIAGRRNVSAYDLKKAIHATCLAMHEAECGSWGGCRGQH